MNAAAPIHRMPVEVLTKIFALSPRAIIHRGTTGSEGSQLAYWPFKAEGDVRDIHKLTEVCRYWRDLAIATPTLWTTIRLGSGENRSGAGSDDFRGNIHSPRDPSRIGFIVHVDHDRPCTHKILDSMLRHSPNIRELHVWDMACITKDVSSFWRAFDASALEHCTLWEDSRLRYRDSPRPPKPNSIPFFFTNDGARLRSLCLSDFTFHVFPPNAFPALTRLLVSASEESRVTMGDLFKFLAGFPRLEELYIYNIQRNPFHTSPTSQLPISLPHLQYLYYAYRQHRDSGWEEGQDPVEHLLSSTAIPPTCHVYFAVDNKPYRGVTDRDILDSVCRYVQGKDATVSHVFLWLISEEQSTMQLVFRQGSLRLQFGTHFECVEALGSFHGSLLSSTEDVRVCYPSAGSYTELVASLHRTLPTVFPNLKALLLVRRNPDRSYSDRVWLDPSRSVATVHLLHYYLADVPASPISTDSDSEEEMDTEAEYVPWHPALDTLWVFVGSQQEIIPLQETLAGRAALGFPIRRLVIHHCFEARSPALARLRDLGLYDVEELILTETRAAEVLSEGDWAVRLPDRFSLPATIHRDWPTVWYGDRYDDAVDEEQEEQWTGRRRRFTFDSDSV